MNRSERPHRRLIGRWWVQLLVALWILAIVTIYVRFRISDLLEIAGVNP